MWIYEKRLQYPVHITQTNPDLALYIMSQYGGPDGEIAASMRYLSQRYSMPFKQAKALLTDIGTEAAKMLRLCAGRQAFKTPEKGPPKQIPFLYERKMS